MTNRQQAHVGRIKAAFCTIMQAKYEKGAEEHGGDLQDMSAATIADNILEEAIDQIVYVLTLKEQLASAGSISSKPSQRKGLISNTLVSAVEDEMMRADAMHGPLTDDIFRAYTIMAEEVGEVSRALLEIRRRFRVAEVECRQHAIKELVQVMSVAVKMIVNLDKEGTLS